MPGEHVDIAFETALKQLNYKNLTFEQLATASEEAKLEDQVKSQDKVGTTVFESIEKSDLLPSEKQEVFQRLVAAGVKQELEAAKDPTTILRENNKMTNFMSAYMKHYSKDYVEAVFQDGMQAVQNTTLPKSLEGKDLLNVGSAIKDVPVSDLKKLESIYIDTASKLVESSERNLSKLSPEARAFLQAAVGPTDGNAEATKRVLSSTMMLRCTCSQITTACLELKREEETKQQGAILLNANVVFLSYSNNLSLPDDEKIQGNKPQDSLAQVLRTPERLESSSEGYSAIAKGGTALEKFASEKQTAYLIEQQKQQNELQKQQTLKPFDDYLKKLEDRREKLANNPSGLDKFKAFFQHGLKGVQGEIDKLDFKIEAAKIAREDTATGVSMKLRNEAVSRLKHNAGTLEQEIQQAKAVVLTRNLEQSMGTQLTVSQKQVERAVDRHDALTPAKKEIAEAIKTQEKVVTIREKLGAKPHTPEDGPKKGIKV
jgi:hypothetical protein